MNVDDARAFLEANHRAVMVTRRKDGGWQTSPVTVGVDGEGRAIVSSRETAYKVRNLRRDNQTALCVMNDRFFGKWMQVEGTVEIVSLPESLELLVDYYRRISGEHPDWDEYRDAMKAQRRVLLRMSIERVGPSREG